MTINTSKSTARNLATNLTSESDVSTHVLTPAGRPIRWPAGPAPLCRRYEGDLELQPAWLEVGLDGEASWGWGNYGHGDRWYVRDFFGTGFSCSPDLTPAEIAKVSAQIGGDVDVMVEGMVLVNDDGDKDVGMTRVAIAAEARIARAVMALRPLPVRTVCAPSDEVAIPTLVRRVRASKSPTRTS